MRFPIRASQLAGLKAGGGQIGICVEVDSACSEVSDEPIIKVACQWVVGQVIAQGAQKVLSDEVRAAGQVGQVGQVGGSDGFFQFETEVQLITLEHVHVLLGSLRLSRRARQRPLRLKRPIEIEAESDVVGKVEAQVEQLRERDR